MNIVLTLAIIAFFQSKPDDYPELSQKYLREKMYEPTLDMKYLLESKEFKTYSLVSAALLVVTTSLTPAMFMFSFVEA